MEPLPPCAALLLTVLHRVASEGRDLSWRESVHRKVTVVGSSIEETEASQGMMQPRAETEMVWMSRSMAER